MDFSHLHHSPMDTSESVSHVNRRRSCPPGLSPSRSSFLPRHPHTHAVIHEGCSPVSPQSPEPMQVSPAAPHTWSSYVQPDKRAWASPESPLQSLTSAFLDLATTKPTPPEITEESFLCTEPPPSSQRANKRVSTPGRYTVIGNNNRFSPTKAESSYPNTRLQNRRIGRSLVPESSMNDSSVQEGFGDLEPLPQLKKFSLDEPVKIKKDVLLKRINEASSLNSSAEPGRRKCCRWWVVVSLFVATAAVILAIPSIHFHQCDRATDLNLSSIKTELDELVFGQHIAVTAISQGLERFLSGDNHNNVMPLVLSLHGWTGIGKNHISNIISRHLPDSCVERIIIPLHFPHYGTEYENSRRLHERITRDEHVSTCCVFLFIVDEVDKADDQMISGLTSAITELGRRSEAAGSPSSVILLLLSNTGGSTVNRYLLEWLGSGHVRAEVDESDLLAAVLEELPEDNWMVKMAGAGLITSLVPFLPLERTHVRQCLLQYAASIHQEEPRPEHVEHALDSLSFFPQGSQRFSKSGCKKISNLYDLAQDLYDSQ